MCDEAYSNFEKAFIEAIGKNRKFDDEDAKRNFAGAVYEEMHYVLCAAEDRKALHKKRQKLAEAALNTKKSLEVFCSEMQDARKGHGSITPLQPYFSGAIEAQHKLKQLIKYLETYHAHLSKLNIAAPKRGPQNAVRRSIAEMLSHNYQRYLGHKPSSAKANKRDRKGETIVDVSPFDRICELVENTWKIEIPISTRLQATGALQELV